MFEPIVGAMAEIECASAEKAVSIAATVALERNEAQLARLMSDLLAD